MFQDVRQPTVRNLDHPVASTPINNAVALQNRGLRPQAMAGSSRAALASATEAASGVRAHRSTLNRGNIGSINEASIRANAPSNDGSSNAGQVEPAVEPRRRLGRRGHRRISTLTADQPHISEDRNQHGA